MLMLDRGAPAFSAMYLRTSIRLGGAKDMAKIPLYACLDVSLSTNGLRVEYGLDEADNDADDHSGNGRRRGEHRQQTYRADAAPLLCQLDALLARPVQLQCLDLIGHMIYALIDGVKVRLYLGPEGVEGVEQGGEG